MGVATVLVRRALMLFIALIVVLFLTAVIIGATGYDERVLRAIVDQQVKAYTMNIIRTMKGATEEEKVRNLIENYKKTLEEVYGLNKPWYERLLPNVYRILTLNLGNATSEDICSVAGLVYPCRVSDVIFAVLPRTIVMLTTAYIICAAIALPLGPWIAYRRGSLTDNAAVTYAALFNARPVWWLGMIFIFVFGYRLGIAPTNYRGVMNALAKLSTDPLRGLGEVLWYAYLPIVTVVITLLGSWIYYTRSMVIRIVMEDFVVVARAKGLPERLIVRRHILRVAAPPIVTYTILGLAASLGGYIITESVFDWPGMGTLYWTAIQVADANTLLALIFMTTIVYVIARFILEVLYVILDPRVRY